MKVIYLCNTAPNPKEPALPPPPDSFANLALPHLDAAYSLARWITGNDSDAHDVAQESFMRALRAFNTFRGDDFRPWLLTIVRNAAYSFLQKSRRIEPLDDIRLAAVESPAAPPPESLAQTESADLLKKRIAELPAPYREALILREIEGLSYKQIADLANVSIGTVMSRLSRARQRLQQSFATQEAPRELR